MLIRIRLIALFTLGCLQLQAQDYRLFDPSRTDFFRETYRSGVSSGTNHWFDPFTISSIKATRIDSVTVSGNDSVFFPFRSWKDTFSVDFQACGFKNGPGWMGKEIRQSNSGQTVLFTMENDSVSIRQTAGFATAWNFLTLPDGKSIIAQFDSLFLSTVAGITDTVKQLRLTALDSSGAIDSLSPLHRRTIWISRSNGLFKTVSFLDLPEYVELQRIEPIATISPVDLYDFDPGDEFEYQSGCQVFTPWPASPPAYQFVRILSKWYTPSLSQDTVCYARMVVGQSFTFNPNPAPHLDTITITRFDTVCHSIPMTPLHSTVPEQNGSLSTINVGLFGTYRLSKDSVRFENRTVVAETQGYYSVVDSCLYLNHFEPVFYTRCTAPGLGEVLYESDERSIAGPFCRNELIWYRKGGSTYGNFYNIFSSIDEADATNELTVFPNPFSGNLSVVADPAKFSRLTCYSADGRLMQDQTTNVWETVFATAEWPSGIYFLRLQGKDRSTVRLLVKQ